MSLTIVGLPKLKQGRRSTIYIKVLKGGDAQSVRCAVIGGDIDFIFLNGSSSKKEVTIEVDENSYVSLSVDPRGHGVLVLAFSLTQKNDEVKVEPFWVAEDCQSLPVRNRMH